MTDNYAIDVDTIGNLKPLNQVVFGLGSNMGDSIEILQEAIDRLADTPNLILVDISSIYRTKPVGYADQDDFYNVVVTADSTLEPTTLLDRAQAIEQALGRVRDPELPNGPRTIDIDLIQVGKRVSATEDLILPHPRAHERAFVLVPWLEIDPRAQLPQGSVAGLLADIDVTGVQRVDDVQLVKP